MGCGVKKHIVNVMRPTKTLSDRGQLQGTAETLIKDWPCEIDPLTGNKLQTERMTVPTATHSVDGYGGGPTKVIMTKDYLTGGNLGDRQLMIEHKRDATFADLGPITLICSEVMLG